MEKKDYLLLAVAISVMIYGFMLVSEAPLPRDQHTYQDDRAGEFFEDDEATPPALQPGDADGPEVVASPETTPAAPRTPGLLEAFSALDAAEPITIETEPAVFHFLPNEGGLGTVILRHLDMTLGSNDLPMLDVQPSEGRWTYSHARVTEQSETGFTIERQVIGRPLVVEQRFRIHAEKYQLTCQIRLRNEGSTPLEVEGLRIRSGVMADLGTPKGFMGAGGMDQRIDMLFEGKKDPKTVTLDKLRKYDAEDTAKLRTQPTMWLAVQNKYFTTIVSGDNRFAGVTGHAAPELAMAVLPGNGGQGTYQGIIRRVGDTSSALTVQLTSSDPQAMTVPGRLRFGPLADRLTFQVTLAEGVTLNQLPPETVIEARADGYIGATTPVFNRQMVGIREFEAPDSRVMGYVYLPDTILEPGEVARHELLMYAGPKRFSLLKELGDNKESLMQFDLFLFMHFTWFEYISRGILWLLTTFYGAFGSYGLAILLITLILRLTFWPITHQSTVMSRKMQAIQPIAKELREKYKDDPRKLQEKTMELYRQHKVNPVSGCLPALLQIPAFFALFNVLRNAIELRHASFLWATDLSLPDTIGHLIGLPINPLALLMGASMVLQMKIVPTTADPAQQRMMMMMSGMFIIFLYTMPSGLTLYWTANQILNIIQYRITHKHMDKKAAEAAATTTT